MIRLWEYLLVREAIFWDLVTCKSSLDNPWTLEKRDKVFRPNTMLLMNYTRQPLSNVRLKGKGWSWDTAWSHQQSSANKLVHKCHNAVHFLPEKLLSKTETARKPIKVPKVLHISPDVWNIYNYICRLVYTLWMYYNSSFGSYKLWINCNSGMAYNCNTCL